MPGVVVSQSPGASKFAGALSFTANMTALSVLSPEAAVTSEPVDIVQPEM